MPLKRRGFTLIELNCVVAIIGILASLAAPAYTIYMRRSQGAEALTNIETIHYLEQVHILEAGQALACAQTPREVPRASRVHFVSDECWTDLGVAMEGRVRFQYAVESNAPRHYVVRARGDLDGDGLESAYAFDSKTMVLKAQAAGE